MMLRDPGYFMGGFALAGVALTLAGFGLLMFDAALGILAIPAGIVLAIASMQHQGDRRR